MTSLRGLLCALVGFGIAAPALAQVENNPILPQVVITADREPVPIEQVTGSVTVITQKEMEERQLRTVDDVLRYVPGVSVQQSGGVGGQTSVFIRGANSNHTVVLIDGMNVNDPSTPNGAVDFAHFITENLDRIEVVRGPMSTLYGSGAIGGVVNMVTKKGEGAFNGSVYGELGTHLQGTTGGYVRGSEGRFNYNITASGLYAQGDTIVPGRFTPPGGFVDNDPYRNITLASRLGVDINDSSSFTWFTRYIDTMYKFDQVALEDPNAVEFTQQLYNRLQFDGSYFNDRWKPTIGINYINIYRHDQDFPSIQNPFPFAPDEYYNGRSLQADFKNQIKVFSVKNAEADLVAGVDYVQNWLYINAEGLQSWGNDSETGIYGQLRTTLFDALTISIAGRNDHHSVYGDNPTWRVGGNYHLMPLDFNFKASYGTAFKAPALFELFGAGFFCAGNPNLQPEHSQSWEAGVDHGLFNGKVRVGITYFNTYIENLIQCPAPYVNLQNVAHARSEGFEATFDANIVSWLDIGLVYTQDYATDTDPGVPPLNVPLLRRPVSTFSGRLAVRPIEGLRIGVDLLSVNGRHDADAITGQPVEPSPYTLIRSMISYDIQKDLQVFARVENLLNVIYEEPEGFNAPSMQFFFGMKARF